MTVARNIFRKSHMTKCIRSTAAAGDAFLLAHVILIADSSVLLIDTCIWRRDEGNFAGPKVEEWRLNVAGKWQSVSACIEY
jgi:hypothetical protein